MLAAKNLTLGERLRDVTVSLERAQITAICGPNGAGKSTLLQALAGLLSVDAGEVALGNEPLSTISYRDRAKRIGYLPQDGEVAWDMTVRNLVALGRLPHGDGARAPVENAIAALGLQEFADRPISRLSGGERARALLARVLAGHPEWILADEPLAALDLAHQQSLLSHLRIAAKAGQGVVLVVHDLALAMNHADRVIVLDKGRIAVQGTPDEALSAELIAQVWGVTASWLGDAGGRALVIL